VTSADVLIQLWYGMVPQAIPLESRRAGNGKASWSAALHWSPRAGICRPLCNDPLPSTDAPALADSSKPRHAAPR
jgi:hypothetical protein